MLCLYTYIHIPIHVCLHKVYKYIRIYTYGNVIDIQASALNVYNQVRALSLKEMQSLRPSGALTPGTQYSGNIT